MMNVMSWFSFWVRVGFGTWLSILLILLINFPFSSPCWEDERSALLDFKSGLVDPFSRLSSWQGYNCCQWEGILCDYESGHVIHLDLKNRRHHGLPRQKDLGGQIRSSLFILQHLQLLDLSYSNFNGSAIPPQLTKLKNLVYLSLSHAGFGGEIPLELGNISTLRYMDLTSDNYDYLYEGRESEFPELKSRRFAVWARNLRSLKHLAMNGVNLSMASEQWGVVLSRLSNLKQIYMSYCGLSGSIPSLLNVTHLSHLHLRRNCFLCQLPSWFQNVSSLVSLDLSRCGLYGSIPQNFLHLSKLSTLDLSRNRNLTGNLSFILSHNSSVTVLSLGGCSLGGIIPPSVTNFANLRELDLGWNNLTGHMPQFGSVVGRLSCLSKIVLNGNNLDGPIPSTMGRLSRLNVLGLGNNCLVGPIPSTISRLVELQVFSVQFNSLTGTFSLSQWGNLSQLWQLDISGNHFVVDVSTSWVPNFQNLNVLGLASCNMGGTFPAFLSTQYSLLEIDLSDNNIVGTIPAWVWDLPNLSRLSLSKNQLQGSLPPVISIHLDVLDLHRNMLQGSLPALDFVDFYLDLSDNEFNGSIPDRIRMPLVLNLSGNNLTGGIPHSICNNLERDKLMLDLSRNGLTDVIPTNLARCFTLQVINFAQNGLQGQIPEGLGNLTDLHTLNLNGNHLQGFIPPSIVSCQNLQVLDLGNNQLEGSIPVWIGELTQIHILSLGSNNFQGSIPPQLMALKNLQILDLSGNNLTGYIPEKLRGLNAMINQAQSEENLGTFRGYYYFHKFPETTRHYTLHLDQITLWMKGRSTPYTKILIALKSIDLSSNQLLGIIPWEMGCLQGVLSLKLSNNKLSGIIPESLSGMHQLESLDLSGNKLTGKIPGQFADLSFLEYLNLSDNMLSGRIPWSKQLTTFDASSFAGNPDLHGPPLENNISRPGQESSQEETHDSEGDENVDVLDRWWPVALGLSYGVGFGLVVGVLCFVNKWRMRYFVFMDRLVVFVWER